MYLGIDIGGTKTYVAAIDNDGVIKEKLRFKTPADYKDFLHELAFNVDKLTTRSFTAAGIGIPGRLDRKRGLVVALAHLPWSMIHIQKDVERIAGCPIIIENDANLAGLSESMLVKDRFNRVLYVTISTGIGSSIINNQRIDPSFVDTEGGQMVLEHDGKLQEWEDFASGTAIVKRFGKRAQDIHEPKSWHIIADNIAVGLIDLIAVVQPEIIIFGGGVSEYYSRFSKFLKADLNRYKNALVPIPIIEEAKRPDDAVLYGCYDLAKATYG